MVVYSTFARLFDIVFHLVVDNVVLVVDDVVDNVFCVVVVDVVAVVACVDDDVLTNPPSTNLPVFPLSVHTIDC